MKFLTKSPKSAILKKGLKYKKKGSNKSLCVQLLTEQKSFCAYTEKYVLVQDEDYLESVDIEHFTAAHKGTNADNYYNWYAVLHKMNIKKADEKYANASFHQSRFFQNRKTLDQRIEYSAEQNLYFPTEKEDTEAQELIEFIQVNSPILYKHREAHLRKLETIFITLNSKEDFINYLLNHREDLSFITAIEQHFDVDLESKL